MTGQSWLAPADRWDSAATFAAGHRRSGWCLAKAHAAAVRSRRRSQAEPISRLGGQSHSAGKGPVQGFRPGSPRWPSAVAGGGDRCGGVVSGGL